MEKKFKVGDKVKRVHTGVNGCVEGATYTVARVSSGWVGLAEVRNESCPGDKVPYLAKFFELACQPENGDIIEVSDHEDFSNKKLARFIGIDKQDGDHWFVCATQDTEGSFTGTYQDFEYARQRTKPRVFIDKETRKEYELSEETAAQFN